MKLTQKLLLIGLIIGLNQSQLQADSIGNTLDQYNLLAIGAALGFTHGLANGFLDAKYPDHDKNFDKPYLSISSNENAKEYSTELNQIKKSKSYRPNITPWIGIAHLICFFNKNGWSYAIGGVGSYPIGYIVGDLICPDSKKNSN